MAIRLMTSRRYGDVVMNYRKDSYSSNTDHMI